MSPAQAEAWMRRALAVASTAAPSGPGGGDVAVGGGDIPVGGGDVAVGGGDIPVGGGDVAVGGGDVPVGDDVPVGAVVFGPDGLELAAARNERERTGDPTAHAEILALRAAADRRGFGWRLDGCTLVVTLEPCTMCAGALVLARVATLVFGAWEPKTGAVGSLWDVVRDRRLNHRPEVYGGVLADECAAMMRDFFRAYRQI